MVRMSYLVLARKYRPQSFDQVVKQDHVTRTLTNAISSGRVPHAILFTGPRGTGKTTVARILAKAMNCKEGPTPTPCNICRSCKEITAGNAVDVFEIDGASNNSVDQIRELRENIKYMPANSPYKIYIIDEVHMLSIAAFNALLKTLEEPPPHVMFIFATTEPHKIPITILSRCQRHDLRRIDIESIAAHMEMVCAQEGVKVDAESLWPIAREASGSIRDALSLLDQVMTCTTGTLTTEQVQDILGVIDRKLIFDIAERILQGNIPQLLDIIDEIYNYGHEIKKLYADLIEHFRNLMVVKMGKKIHKLVDLPAHEIDRLHDQIKGVSQAFLNQIFDLLFKEEAVIRLSSQPKLALEMTLIRILQIKPALPIDVLIKKLDHLKREFLESPKNTIAEDSAGQWDVSTESDMHANSLEYRASSNSIPNEESTTALVEKPVDKLKNEEETWNRLIDIVSEKHPSLAANLIKCRLKQLTGQSLEIEVNGNGFNQNMISRDKNRVVIEKTCEDFFGKKMDLVITARPSQIQGCQSNKNQASRLKQEALNHPLVSDAIEIFNGKVVDVKTL
jgi:DNA polymerase-3 subunit gamma/tau